MKQKEAISRARLHKLARLGIGLAAVTVLGGLAMTTSPLLGSVQVEAQEVTDQTSTEQTPPVSQEAKTVTFVTNYHDENGTFPFAKVVTLYPGGSYTFDFYGDVYIPREGQPLSYHYDEVVDGATYSLDLSRNPNPTIITEYKTVTFTLTVAGETTPLSYQVTLRQGQVYNALVDEGKYTLLDGQKATYNFDEIEDGGVYNLNVVRKEENSSPSVEEVAKTVDFYSSDGSGQPLTAEKVTLFPGDSYTFAFNPATHILPENEKLTYSYDELADQDYVSLSLATKAQTQEDQSVRFEVETIAGVVDKGGSGVLPIEHKTFTLKLGESIILTPPTYEAFESVAEYYARIGMNLPEYIPETITNDGKTAIKGRYTIEYQQKSMVAPVAPTGYKGRTLPAVDKTSYLKVVHFVNGIQGVKELIRYSVPANGAVAPLLLVKPNYGQLLSYEVSDWYGTNQDERYLALHYHYPEDQLPGGSIDRIPVEIGVWNDKITPAADANNTDTPTTPITPTNPTEPTKPIEEPKQPETPPVSEDKQVEDLTSGDGAVAVRVFGSDVAAVDRIVVNKETNPAVLAALPAGYPAQDADLYDIKTLDSTGQFVQIGAEAQVTLPVAADRVVEKVIYFLPSTGAVEELPFEWNKATNTVSFMVSHFSHYGLIYRPVSNPSPLPPTGQVTTKPQTGPASPQVATTGNPQNQTVTPTPQQASSQTLPKTGETGSLMTIAGLGLAGLAGTALVRRPRRQKR